MRHKNVLSCFLEAASGPTINVQQAHQAELLLCNGKRVLQIVARIGRIELAEVKEVGAMLVDDGVEGQAVAPAGGEVLDVDSRIPGNLALAPEEEGLLCRLGVLSLDFGHLEPKDDRPDEPQGQRAVAIDNVLCSNGLQFYLRGCRSASRKNERSKFNDLLWWK